MVYTGEGGGGGEEEALRADNYVFFRVACVPEQIGSYWNKQSRIFGQRNFLTYCCPTINGRNIRERKAITSLRDSGREMHCYTFLDYNDIFYC